MPPRLSGLKVFRPDVEFCIRVGLAVVMLTAILMPAAWAYRQRAEAELWREVACTYRLKEALRDRLVSAADLNGRPCARLVELGLELERPRLLPAARTSTMADPLVWPAASISH